GVHVASCARVEPTQLKRTAETAKILVTAFTASIAVFDSDRLQRTLDGPTRSRAMTPKSPAAHRRHHHLVAPAGPPGHFRTIVEFQILGQTDSHFGQTLPVAIDGDRGRGQAGIGLD